LIFCKFIGLFMDFLNAPFIPADASFPCLRRLLARRADLSRRGRAKTEAQRRWVLNFSFAILGRGPTPLWSQVFELSSREQFCHKKPVCHVPGEHNRTRDRPSIQAYASRSSSSLGSAKQDFIHFLVSPAGNPLTVEPCFRNRTPGRI
jgi:hypothetical protein